MVLPCKSSLPSNSSMTTMRFNAGPGLWKPESRREIIEYYQMILDILIEQLDRDDDCRNEAVCLLMDGLDHLVTVTELAERVLDTLEYMHVHHKADDEKLLDKITLLIDLRGDTLAPETLDRLKRLRNDITGTDFHSLMKRYVGMEIMADLTRHNEGQDDPREREIERLAKLSTNQDKLKPELNWLLAAKTRYVHVFGYQLALQDPRYELLSVILDGLRHTEEGNALLVGGYLLRMYECDIEMWESQLEAIYCDPILQKLLPEITYRSGMTDRAAERITRGIRERKFDCALLGIFSYGMAFDRISVERFIDWIELLLAEKNDRMALIALKLFHTYFVLRKKTTLPKQLTLDLLLHPNIIRGSPDALGFMSESDWNEIGLILVEQYPDAGLLVAKTVLENFDTADVFTHYRSRIRQVLDKIVETHPREVLDIVSEHMGPPIDSRAYGIRQWLSGGTLAIVPMSDVLDWIDKDEESRIQLVARYLSPQFENVREFLVMYGDRQEVKRFLSMNFDTESWFGSEVAHYTEKKQQFEDIRRKETDTNVLSWLDYYIDSLDDSIKRAKGFEERFP